MALFLSQKISLVSEKDHFRVIFGFWERAPNTRILIF